MPAKAPPSATAKKSSNDTPNDEDEIPWFPVFRAIRYQALKRERIQFVIDMPGSFTGDEGAWKGGVDRDNSCFFLKYKVDDIFLDPHHITSYLSEQHGRMFASDSAYCTEFEENNDFKEKWCTFRYALPFKCFDDFSQDMGHPGLIFLTMNEVNLIIVELASLHQVRKSDGVFKLKKSTFRSPVKSKSKKNALTEIANFIEFLIEKGENLDKVRAALKVSSASLGVDPDAMDIEEMYTSISEQVKKRKMNDVDDL